MKHVSQLCALTAVLVAAGLRAEERSEDDAAIRSAVQSYVDAFNQGDAEAVAAHWSDTGQWISPSGDRIEGREAILDEMKAYFAEGEQPHIEVFDPQIRFLAPTVAVEEGSARVTRSGEQPSDTSYIAIHVKQEDQWKLDSVRETEIPTQPSNYEHLKELEWMVGTWIDQDDETTIETKCDWTKNRSFLTRSFTVRAAGKIELEGTQVIGWDAVDQKIRSWVFDTDGGFGDSEWTRDGDRWIIKNSQKLAGGQRASSINVITYFDENTCTWQSSGREIDGELQPDVGPVTVVRTEDDQ